MTDIEKQAIDRFPRDFVGGGRDFKAWAKRILWREEQGDLSLLSIQVSFAKIAMNVKEEATA